MCSVHHSLVRAVVTCHEFSRTKNLYPSKGTVGMKNYDRFCLLVGLSPSDEL